MARGKSRRGTRQGRDSFAISNGTLPLDSAPFGVYTTPNDIWGPLGEHEDRRTWHPNGIFRPARSFWGRPMFHRLVLVDRLHRLQGRRRSLDRVRGLSQTHAVVAFREPDRVLVCVRRAVRREVMHAIGKAGGTGQRPPKRSWLSSVSCRR